MTLFETEKFKKKLRFVTFAGMENSMMLKYIHEDFVMAFKEMGHDVFCVDLPKDFIINAAYLQKINSYKPDMVFTLENHALHPDFVEILRVPVISFCIDDPHTKTRMEYSRSNFFMFVTEADDAMELQQIGFPNAFNLPIGANPKRFYSKPISEVPEGYHCDVSFVAISLSDSVKAFEKAPAGIMPVIEPIRELLSKNLQMTLEEAIASLGLTSQVAYSEKYVLEKVLRIVTRTATAKHRLMFLEKLSGKQGVKVFGDAGWQEMLPGVPCIGRVDYGTELVDVYNASKINLGLNNYGLVGIHARVLDAALCKAFGLYEYTPGLEKYFTYGEDVVWFKTPEEMAEKIEFYLAHPDERKRIAENAYRNVMENHTTLIRARKMLDTVIQEM